jgi:hypothetical protein
VEDRTRAWLELSYLRAIAGFRARDPKGDVYGADSQPRDMTGARPSSAHVVAYRRASQIAA